MNIAFDSIKDKGISFKRCIESGRSHIIKSGSHIDINCNIDFSSKIKIVLYAKNLSGLGCLIVSIDGEDKRVVVSSKKTKEYPVIFEIKNLLRSKRIKIYSERKRDKIVFERALVYCEYSKNITSKSNVKNINVGYNKKIGFIVPYSIYGGAEVYLKNILNQNYYDNYKLICLSENKIKNYIKEGKLISSNFKNLDLILKKENFDIICFYNSKKVYNKVLPYRKYSKVVEIYHSDFKWQDSMSSIENHNVDLIIRVSDNIGKSIKNIDEISCVIPPSIDFDLFRPLKRNSEIIGTVSRLSDEKNLKYLIGLKRLLPNKEFVVFGEGSEDIKRMLNNNKISTMGFFDKIYNKYNFGAFILPSNNEGLPLTVLESLACNIPCIAKNIGGIGQLLSEFDYDWQLTGVPEEDAKKIASASNLNFNSRSKILDKFNSKDIAQSFFNSIIYKNKNNKVWKNTISQNNPNDYFDKIYCINLDRRKDKWQNVMSKFSKWDLNVERYSAKSPMDPEVNFFWRKAQVLEPNVKTRRGLKMVTKPGEVGCFISHLDIINKSKAAGYKRILIFEDDVIFHKKFNKEFKFINTIRDWAIIYFGASQYSWNKVTPHSSKFYESKDTDGTFAYAINMDYYDEIVSCLSEVQHPIDWCLRVGVQDRLPGKCFTFFPNIVIADTSDSDIRGGRSLAEHAGSMKWDLRNYDL